MHPTVIDIHEKSERKVLANLSGDIRFVEGVIDSIGSLCASCYSHRINPLPGLRAYFPGYAWSSINDDAENSVLLEKIFQGNIVLDDGWGTYTIGVSRIHQSSRFFWSETGGPSVSEVQLTDLKSKGFKLLPLSKFK